MASPSYYDNSTHAILDGTIAAASDVEAKCDDIATSFADVAADMDNTLRFTAEDFTDQTSAANAATRASKVVGFDVSGALELKPGFDTYVTAAQAAQAAAELAEMHAEAAYTHAIAAKISAQVAQGGAEAAQTAAQGSAAAALTSANNAAQSALDAAASAVVASPNWAVKTSLYTAVNGERLVGDTSGGGFTITLPATPSAGYKVQIKSTKDAQTNNLTIGRNGSNINGTAADLVIDVNYFEATFVYVGASIGWSM